MIILRILGTVMALPHTALGWLLMLIPWWRGTWFPYAPRDVRLHNWTVHVIAGRLIPKGMGDRFVTGAQTHGSIIFFRDERAWNRESLVRHEERHTRQEWLFGPLYVVLYIVCFLVNLVRLRDATAAYEAIPFEKDARKHEHG
jgi:hypothetical protein